MKKTETTTSHLVALPTEMKSEILSKVAADSREDVKNCILTCKEVAKSANDSQVFKNMNLQDIATSPLLAANHYKDLIKNCINHSNPTAHYIKGVLEFFYYDDAEEGLWHLYKAANATVPIQEAVYLYGIIKLCTGEFEIGKQYLDQLRSHNDKSKADKCWSNIKRSLHGIGNTRKEEYIESLWMMVPPYVCNLNDMENICDNCYHYKQMLKFIYTI